MHLGKPSNHEESGFCICPVCGTRVPHRDWITCLELSCPSCGVALMVREGSVYHAYLLSLGSRAQGEAEPETPQPQPRANEVPASA